MNMKSLFLTSFAALVFAGCSSTPPIQQKDPVQNDDDDDDDSTGAEAPVDAPPNTAEVIAGVRQALEGRCVGCHGEKAANAGGLKQILDTDTLITDGIIVPNKADASPLFNKIKDGDHPAAGTVYLSNYKKTTPVTELEVGLIKNWIDTGAPSLRGNREFKDLQRFV
jgi:hypothetical protein